MWIVTPCSLLEATYFCRYPPTTIHGVTKCNTSVAILEVLTGLPTESGAVSFGKAATSVLVYLDAIVSGVQVQKWSFSARSFVSKRTGDYASELGRASAHRNHWLNR